jgi:hypothetical protein
MVQFPYEMCIIGCHILVEGCTPLEALPDELKKEEHGVYSWQEINGRLTALFFASVDQIELMRCFPDVIT